MIVITPSAQKSLREFLDRMGAAPSLRLVIAGEAVGAYHPSFLPMGTDAPGADDTLVNCGELKIYLDAESARKADGLVVDLLHTEHGPRLKFDFPPPKWDDPLAERLQRLIDQRINPGLLSHGGYVALLGVREGTAEVLMGGGCQGCMLSAQIGSQTGLGGFVWRGMGSRRERRAGRSTPTR